MHSGYHTVLFDTAEIEDLVLSIRLPDGAMVSHGYPLPSCIYIIPPLSNLLVLVIT